MTKIMLTLVSRLTVQRGLLLTLASLVLCSTIGCGGGGMSQADMMKRARKRTQKEKEAEADKPKVVKQAAPESSTPAQPEPNENNLPAENLAAENLADKSPQQSPAASPKAQSAPQEITTDTRKKPTEPLSYAQRSQLSAANLQRIAAAMEAYLEDKNLYPPQAIYTKSKAPLLSWRVELLPYLGYQELYNAFDLTKPWNSPANKPLLEKIPAVYQSPERFDSKTNYLLAVGSSTLFPNARTKSLRRVEDGIEHCALIVEANDELAAPWTKPKEFQVNLRQPKAGLGKLRAGDAFVIWGGGITGAVPTKTADKNFKAMFTIDGGEPFSSYGVSVPLDEDYFSQQAQTAPSSVPLTTSNRSQTTTSSSSSGRPQASLNLNSGLASELFEAATTSYAMNEPANAMLWYYASNLLQLNNPSWAADYRWVPALKRPSATVHFCVGVQTKISNRKSGSSTRRKAGTQRSVIVSHISGTGEQLLSMIEKHAESLAPAALATTGANTKDNARGSGKKGHSRLPIPVSYLGVGTRSELAQKAVTKAADVLVLFQIKAVAGGARSWLDMELVDIANGKKIVGVSRIPMVADASNSPLLQDDETFKKARWRLADTLEDRLSLQDWPEGLKPRHAAARVAALADVKMLNPLAALAEMGVYRNRDFIDTQQLLQAYRALLGEEAGEALMLGSDKKRKRVLRKWLPDIQPSELQQLAQLQRKNRDDNN